MRRRGTCPKCNSATVFEVKYLPLIDVPKYAQFQPLETFAVCLSCDSGGVIKRDMLPYPECLPVTGEFWSMDEVEKYRRLDYDTRT